MAWRNASREHPCAICTKPDWCRYEEDAGIVDCFRACGPGGVQKQDKIGQAFWRHYSRGEGPPAGTTGSSRASSDEGERDPAAHVAHEHQRADAGTLHDVYSDLIAALPLYERHREQLREKRKLTDEEIDLLGYRSFPDGTNAPLIIDQLVAKHGIDRLLTVPGFDRPERHVDMVDQTNGQMIKLDATEMRLSGAPGILLPQRDVQGRVVGMMLRLDDPPNPDPEKKTARYLPLTSYTYAGCAAAIGVHVPRRDVTSIPLGVRVIEGVIKADIATLRTGVLTVGIQSGGRWEQGILVAEQLGAAGILLSPDADTRGNAGICATLTFAAHALTARGGGFWIEVWPPDAGKGLDDVINAGRRADVNVLGGVERWRTLKEWSASSGAPHHPGVSARLFLHDVVEQAARDPFSVFRPGVADALAALEAGTVEVQRIMTALKERIPGSWRDFEKKVGAARAQRSKALRKLELKQVAQSGRHVFQRGDQVEARDVLLDELTPVGGSGFDHTLCVFDGGNLYKFDDGIYAKLDEAALITRVTAFAGSPIVGGDVLRVSRNFAKGAVELAYDKSSKDGFFRDAPHGVVFKDVFLRVDPKAKTLRDEPLAREHRVRTRYPFAFEKGAKPVRLLRLLHQALDGKENEEDQADSIRAIQQFTGASLVGLAARFQRAVIFRGKGNDAKSTVAAILSHAMPAGSVSAVPPQSFGHPYSRAALEGMLLNCVSETPEHDILDAGTLKAVITGDPMEARNPYARPFTLVPRAGQLFVLNNIFKIKDTSRAFRRRWIIIDFENAVEVVDRFKFEQLKAETPAIVSWAVEGLHDLLANDYTIPTSSDAAVDEWLGECDTVRQYVEAQLVPLTAGEKANSAIKWMRGELLYADYKAWVRDNGHGQPLTSIRFLKRIKSHLGMGKTEGHKSDGNYYPVRLRDFARMLQEAKENGDVQILDSEQEAVGHRVLDSRLLHGEHRARVHDGYPETGGLVLDIALDREGRVARLLHETPYRGDDLRRYGASIMDERAITVVTFEQVREGGNVIAKIVRLERPAPVPAEEMPS